MSTNGAFSGLIPCKLWAHFADFTKIARPSGKEAELACYLVGWATGHGFNARKDAAGNVRVCVPATMGREGSATVILQGHMDMVCLRDDATGPYDPEQGRIRVFRADRQGDAFVEAPHGDWIKADKTTLGADNGIGIAAMLAICEDPAVCHGPLELLFTVREEAALAGALELDPSLLTGKKYLNLDSEQHGVLTIGSAGGRRTILTWSQPLVPIPEEFKGFQLTISGLRGGHSGLDINSGRLNALHALAIVLREASKEIPVLRLVSISSKNTSPSSIPADASTIIAIPIVAQTKLETAVERARIGIKSQYEPTEPALDVSDPDPIDKPLAKGFSDESTRVFLRLLRVIPAGVIGMSQKFKGLVETSTNLGGVKTETDTVTMLCLSRSSVGQALEDITDTLRSLGELGGANVNALPPLPGWEPNLASPLLSELKNTYRKLYHSDPDVTAVHAGLECGVIRSKISGLDAVSFGPTIYGAHSTSEAVNIKSVEEFFTLLMTVLDDLSTKSVG